MGWEVRLRPTSGNLGTDSLAGRFYTPDATENVAPLRSERSFSEHTPFFGVFSACASYWYSYKTRLEG